MTGAYIAATVVALAQYLRLRDRRVLPLAAMFAFQAQASSRDWFDVWKDVYEIAACGAGLLMLLVLTLRHPATIKPASELVRPAAPVEDAPSNPPSDERQPPP